jgi:polar amino acid transport system ATP-binding protein
MGEALIEIRGLHKRFGANPVLRGITLSVERGGVVALIGASGSGKSTLLRCVNLLCVPDAGSVSVAEQRITFSGPGTALPSPRDLARFRARTGMVFQQFNLFPHMTALQNVMEGPLTVLKTPPAQAREHARELLHKVGLAARADVYPEQLSGGQKQRVAIARALAMQPRVMLFDEATSALDPALVGEVLQVIRGLAREGMTMLLVTHEMAFAREVADQVVFLSDGVVAESGAAADVLARPRSDAARAFLARFNSAGHGPAAP